MNWRCDYRGWHFHIGLSRSVKANGVCSDVGDGKHILMWDFDNVPGGDVVYALSEVQEKHRLSSIYLINTGLPRYYHAYCFTAREWPQVLYILADTKFLDQIYFKIGVVRGFFTLRYSKKEGRQFRQETVLTSTIPQDIDPFQLTHLVKYWTKRL